ncbi:MAG TPA: HAD-IIIA family hydrolase [Thermoanaerobaculia bacterium]|jgi:phosphoglycolate phosphatase|nr:HAD-IIIA family hydrolase [Thermoanaerobaculia bacterium]
MDLRLLVFDWDGTLMDSIGSIVACTRAMMDELGLHGVPDETVRGTIGLGLRETMEVLCPGGGEEMFARILEIYRKHWVATWRDQPVLFVGVREMLAELAAQGYLLAVATGKSRRGLDHVLAQTGLDRGIFQATRTVDEAFSKPHPQMLLDILDELGVQPGAAVMIGDTTYDLEMALNARTAAVGVCSGSHGRDELLRLRPLACLEAVAELPGWLAGLQEPAAVLRA